MRANWIAEDKWSGPGNGSTFGPRSLWRPLWRRTAAASSVASYDFVVSGLGLGMFMPLFRRHAAKCDPSGTDDKVVAE